MKPPAKPEPPKDLWAQMDALMSAECPSMPPDACTTKQMAKRYGRSEDAISAWARRQVDKGTMEMGKALVGGRQLVWWRLKK